MALPFHLSWLPHTCSLGWFHFLCAAFSGRHALALLASPLCWGFQYDLGRPFMASHIQWPIKAFIKELLFICLTSVAPLNHGRRSHNPFIPISIRTLKPGHTADAAKFSLLLWMEPDSLLELNLHTLDFLLFLGPGNLWDLFRTVQCSWIGSWTKHTTPLLPFGIEHLFISFSTSLGSSVKFPGTLFLLKLYMLYFFLSLLFFTIEFHKSLLITTHQSKYESIFRHLWPVKLAPNLSISLRQILRIRAKCSHILCQNIKKWSIAQLPILFSSETTSAWPLESHCSPHFCLPGSY